VIDASLPIGIIDASTCRQAGRQAHRSRSVQEQAGRRRRPAAAAAARGSNRERWLAARRHASCSGTDDLDVCGKVVVDERRTGSASTRPASTLFAGAAAEDTSSSLDATTSFNCYDTHATDVSAAQRFLYLLHRPLATCFPRIALSVIFSVCTSGKQITFAHVFCTKYSRLSKVEASKVTGFFECDN